MEILGIDIGGSGIKGAIVDTKKGVLVSDRFRVETPKPSTPIAVAQVIKEIKDHFQWTDDIGCAFPTVVKCGKAMYNSNLDKAWKGQQIDDLFSEYCDDLKFTIINDADAAGIAEMKFGAGKNKSGLVMTITIGTGLGSGAFFNGELIPNFEVGRMFGKDGKVIERYAADSARKREDLSFKDWGKRLNFFLKHVERVFSPDYIILGGGVSKKIHLYRKQIDIKTPYSVSEKLNNAGIIGAAVNAAIRHK
ncbi:polyphosphate--glucose phosphotransferase [Fulvivirga ligni]|uniref:polyphosphate--glucose phosphotransferase n=1 Tax=Fulvivirga ligni TaxID=2904246 RepID=UPI001F4139D6|nr:ROK family protein [Fulvivirga ligni]UII19820.1 ROK family protein [Fulvivirga ligni]